MIISGIERLVLSVPNVENALGFYQDIIGMKVVARSNLNGNILHGLWGLPSNFTGKSVCLKNSKQETAIELVEFEPTPQKSARDNALSYDYGFFDVCYLVSDALKIETKLKKKGYQFFSNTYRYPTWPSGTECAEGFIYGPAREVVAMVQIFSPPVEETQKLDGDFWTLLDMAQVMGSMEEAYRFYRDALGLTLISDNQAIPKGFLDAPLHLPQGTQPRIVMFNHPQSNGPVVELLATSAKGRPLGTSVEKLGILMIAFESSDLENDVSKITNNGFKVISGPVQVETSLQGKVRAVDIEGPSQVRVEIFQKLR